MSLRQQAVNGVVWSVIQRWGSEAISFLVLVVLSRLLDPKAFGLVALAIVFTAFVEIFLDQGFAAAIVQRDDLERKHLDTAFWSTILIGSMLTAGVVAGSGLAASLMREPALASVLRWLSATFILSALSSTQMAILRREMAFKSLAVRSMTARMVGGVVGVYLAYSGFGVWSLVGQKLAEGVAGVVVLWRVSDWRPSFAVSREHYRELLTFGVSVAGNNILKVLVRRSDDFLIGYFLGPTLLGYYTIGYRLLLVMIRLVTGIVNAVAFPAFSRLQNDPKRMLRAFYKVTQYTSLLAFPVFIGLATLAPELIPALFGEQWVPSVPVMQVLALIGILQSVQAFNGSVLRASGKPSWELGLMFLTAASSVLAFLVAVQWGIVAVAASFVIVSYLIAPLYFVAARRLITIDLGSYLRQFVVPLLSSLTMVVVIVGLKQIFGRQEMNLYLELSVYVTAGALTYLTLIALFARALSRQVLELARLALPSLKLKES